MAAKTCPVCDDRLAGTTTTECPSCHREFHRACEEYHRAFDSRCGVEKWIGAVEF